MVAVALSAHLAPAQPKEFYEKSLEIPRERYIPTENHIRLLTSVAWFR